jgi:hypothetical protein
VAVTRDSSFLFSIYVDGTLEGTTQGASQDLTHTTGVVSMTLASSIDDLRFYNGTALSATQVSNIYNSGLGVRPKESGFEKIASNGFYVSFTDGSGTTISGRKVSSGTWSDYDGTVSIGTLTWTEGGVPFDSQELTSSFAEHTFYVNNTSRKIQFRFRGSEDFKVKKFKVLDPQVLSDR